MFPASLLARLFVKGSLKNTENGFEMKLKNIIDSGTLVGLGPLVVDDIQCFLIYTREVGRIQFSLTEPLS